MSDSGPGRARQLFGGASGTVLLLGVLSVVLPVFAWLLRAYGRAIDSSHMAQTDIVIFSPLMAVLSIAFAIGAIRVARGREAVANADARRTIGVVLGAVGILFALLLVAPSVLALFF